MNLYKNTIIRFYLKFVYKILRYADINNSEKKRVEIKPNNRWLKKTNYIVSRNSLACFMFQTNLIPVFTISCRVPQPIAESGCLK